MSFFSRSMIDWIQENRWQSISHVFFFFSALLLQYLKRIDFINYYIAKLNNFLFFSLFPLVSNLGSNYPIGSEISRRKSSASKHNNYLRFQLYLIKVKQINLNWLDICLLVLRKTLFSKLDSFRKRKGFISSYHFKCDIIKAILCSKLFEVKYVIV